MQYSIKFYINIKTLMSLAWSVCVLFMCLLQSVSREQFLNTTSLLLLFGFTVGGNTGVIVIVPLTSIYASLQWYKLYFSIEVLNLVWLLVLYVLHVSSFTSTQFFVLHLVGWFLELSKKFIIFWYSVIILLY